MRFRVGSGCVALAVVAAFSVGCPRRARLAGTVDSGVTQAAAVRAVVQGVTLGRGAHGPWRAQGVASAAVSPAVSVGAEVCSVLALPEESLGHAELRWVRWGTDGATVVDRRQATGMAPGSAMALVPRAGGHTLVWLAPPKDGGGGDLRALDVGAQGFTGDERAAGEAEAAGGRWLREVMARRAREKADEPAPVPPSEAALVSVVEVRRAVAVVTAGGTEVARGEDLLGYERAVGAADTVGAVRWVALSRGRCNQARVEVYRVAGGASTLRASFPIGQELGVPWITVVPDADGAVVTWYQELVPLRLECARGTHAPGIAEHGVRVGVIRGEGIPGPRP